MFVTSSIIFFFISQSAVKVINCVAYSVICVLHLSLYLFNTQVVLLYSSCFLNVFPNLEYVLELYVSVIYSKNLK